MVSISTYADADSPQRSYQESYDNDTSNRVEFATMEYEMQKWTLHPSHQVERAQLSPN